jgi:hypothetical protein
MVGVLKYLRKISPATIFEKRSADSDDASMISPFWDFFFVGGVSFIFLPLIFITDESFIQAFAVTAFALTFLINNPHFIHSYQLLYSHFWKKVMHVETSIPSRIRLWISGLIVPAILFAILAVGLFQSNRELLGFSANLMFFLVGWHYIKQGYGVLITLSVRHKVFYADWQKKLFLYNGYLCWITFWATHNSRLNEDMLYGLPYWGLSVPAAITDILILISTITSVAVLIALYRHYESTKKFCFNGVVGYVSAIYIWLLIASFHTIFIIAFPALHSLQYLLFVWKMKYEKRNEDCQSLDSNKASDDVARYMLQFFCISVIIGALVFYIAPTFFDAVLPYDQEYLGTKMFLFAFIIFINVHHYFIDFAIWRKDNPDMKYLFR